MLQSWQGARNRVTVSVIAVLSFASVITILSLPSVSEVETALSVCPIFLPVHPPAYLFVCLPVSAWATWPTGRSAKQAKTGQGSCRLFSSLSSHLSLRIAAVLRHIVGAWSRRLIAARPLQGPLDPQFVLPWVIFKQRSGARRSLPPVLYPRVTVWALCQWCHASRTCTLKKTTPKIHFVKINEIWFFSMVTNTGFMTRSVHIHTPNCDTIWSLGGYTVQLLYILFYCCVKHGGQASLLYVSSSGSLMFKCYCQIHRFTLTVSSECEVALTVTSIDLSGIGESLAFHLISALCQIHISNIWNT
jgi:hypothetical protein